jgi:putative ABC transport system permease protein
VLRVPKGFDVEHVITQDVSLNIAKYKDPDRNRFVDEALTRLAMVPGVRSVGVTNQTPLRGETWICELRDASHADRPANAIANVRFVSPGYWSAIGIPLRKGRLLESADRNRGVAVVGEAAARLLWPGMDPIGKRIASCGPEPLEVIGVVGEVRASLEREPPLTVYQPYWTSALTRPSFVVRTDAEPAATAARIRASLRSLDADVPISPATSMKEVLDAAIATRRFQMNLVVAFAIVALFLASVGVYGVVSFTVAQTTPEIGIRMALGAHATEVMTLVLRRGLVPVAGGLAAGLAGAFLASRLITSQLYGVMPNDVSLMLTVSFLVMSLALCACWIPARRATRISPLRALRFE